MFLQLNVFPEFALHFSSPGYKRVPDFTFCSSILAISYLRQWISFPAKVKLSLCLISYALCHDDIWGNGSIVPTFLTLALDRSKWSASHPAALALGNRSRYPLDRRLGRPQSQSGHWSKILPCPKLKLGPSSQYPTSFPVISKKQFSLKTHVKWLTHCCK
jgi:hypothetical protein